MRISISKLIQPKYLLIPILIFSLFVRVYKISEVPPSLSWDETSIGYDAWSILQDGKDQWGEKFPVIFRSFGEYKYPFHIYTTALFIKLFGLSDGIVRLPSVLLGVVNILLLFFLVRYLSKNIYIALLSLIFLSISPWHIQFSRMNWETNFTLFLFFMANILFFTSIKVQKKWKRFLIPISYYLFGLTVFTYNAAKVFIPLYVIFLSIIYFKQLTKHKVLSTISIISLIIIFSLNILNPKISGTIRFQKVNFPNDWIITTNIYKLTSNRYLSRMEIIFKQYASHFSPTFLFISGDQNPRHSSQYTGEIYLFDGLFIFLGLYLLLKRRNREDLIMLLWFFLAPIPASIVKEAPHASRAMFALGSWQIVSATGLLYLFSKIKNKIAVGFFVLVIVLLIILSFGRYFRLYINDYPVKYSQAFQYGYKQIFTIFKNDFPKYDHILISDEYAQPYIFALYYLKYDPMKFRAEAIRNNPDQWGFSTVKSFNNFSFDKIRSDNLPKGRSLIFASPNEKLTKESIKDVILNLDNSVAFYVYEYEK